MHRLTTLWLAIVQSDTAYLAQVISWQADGAGRPAVFFLPDTDNNREGRPAARRRPEREVIASAQVRPEWLQEFKGGDLLEPAQRYLQVQVQAFLIKYESKPEFDWNRTEGFTFHVSANSLLGDLWVEFAQAIAENKTYRRCEECRTWFEIAPDVARTHRRYCSERCRGKSYRGRQDRARQLHAGKKTFKQIAEELDSDVATVKRWITGFKE